MQTGKVQFKRDVIILQHPFRYTIERFLYFWGIAMKQFVWCCVIGIQVAGCASTQLNYNTLDLASTVDSLVTRQVLDNLSKIIDNPLAIPAQVDLAAGSATTSNTITPSITDPYTKAVTATNTLTSAVAATVTNTTTNTTTRASSPQSTGLNVSDTWLQNWTIAPVTGSDDLRRLRALYRYQFSADERILKREYPLIKQTRTETIKVPGDSTDCPLLKTWDPEKKEYKNFSTDCSQSVPVQAIDPSFLEMPGCVLCANPNMRKPLAYQVRDLRVNPNIPTHWLYWKNLPGALNAFEPELPPDAVSLGIYGHHQLFVRAGEQSKLSEFTLFIREATGTGGSAGGGTSSSKGGAAGKAIFVTPPGIVVP